MHNNNKNSIIIDPVNSNPLKIAELIASCEFIISSSLHGLIAADALNVPNVWMKISNGIIGGNWKFNDYFFSIKRNITEPLIINNLSAKHWENHIQITNRKILDQKLMNYCQLTCLKYNYLKFKISIINNNLGIKLLK